MNRTVRRTLLVVIGIAVLSGPALAEPGAKKPPPAKGKIDLLDMLGAGDMLGGGDMAAAAADLRKAADAFERFGNALKTLVPTMAEALVESSRNLSNVGHAFDPLGTKAALVIIREQSQTIGALQQAEILRLRAENERLKKALEQRSKPAPRQAKKRKKGPK